MSQLLVFLQQLRRIAARPAVDTIDLLTALLTIPAAATPTVITTIVIQGYFPQNPWLPTESLSRVALRRKITDRCDCRDFPICRAEAPQAAPLANDGGEPGMGIFVHEPVRYYA